MLNINKLSLQAARRIVLAYKENNIQPSQEYIEAYTKIKLLVNEGYELLESYTEENGALTLYFEGDENTLYNNFTLTFNNFREKQVAEAFSLVYISARGINNLCF
jgi:hypothetical protein